MRTLLFGLVFESGRDGGRRYDVREPAVASGANLALLDTNRDGQLSFSEAFPHPQLSGAFNILDTNADGSLSRGEVAAIVR